MVAKPTLTQQHSHVAPTGEHHRVLIVDRSAENREVLRTVLQRSGCEIFEADRDTDGLALAKSCHPNLLVIDVDTVDPADALVCDGYGHQARLENASIVLLGRVSTGESHLPTSDVVAKPYHYGPLIRKIERLLRQADAA